MNIYCYGSPFVHKHLFLYTYKKDLVASVIFRDKIDKHSKSKKKKKKIFKTKYQIVVVKKKKIGIISFVFCAFLTFVLSKVSYSTHSHIPVARVETRTAPHSPFTSVAL